MDISDVETRTVINIILSLLLLIVIIAFGLDMKVPYPPHVVRNFDQPLVRLLTYVALYMIAYYNPVVSILAFMCVIFLHIDYVNLVTKKSE